MLASSVRRHASPKPCELSEVMITWRTSPVGAYMPNGYDLCDMIGNVWDWTSDWYEPKHPAEAAKPAALKGREDWREVPLITIDPPDAKDHDDAVYAEVDPDNPDGAAGARSPGPRVAPADHCA